MTLKEAVEDFQYDVTIYYCVDDIEEGWSWEVNGGYCQQFSTKYYKTAAEAEEMLINFLNYFKGFDK